MKKQKNQKIKELGDFQTPIILAEEIVNHLNQLGVIPSSIIEPTCGTGSFILACIDTFQDARIFGFDINNKYLNDLSEKLSQINASERVILQQADFFNIDWSQKIGELIKPILVLGNPPWITSSEIGTLGGTNVPEKHNIYGYQGMDAKTGKSNFDISEWMIIELLKTLNGHSSTLAMLCKVAVARKVLMYAFKEKMPILSSAIYLIDAKEHFGASVDACLFICSLKPDSYNYSCLVYQNLNLKRPIQEIGYINGRIIGNIPFYKKWKHLLGVCIYTWRSGIKHDCVKVMELRQKENQFINGFGEIVSIEEDLIYPMLKSSDLANNRVKNITRWMVVTQKVIGEDTSTIRQKCPLTWHYLENYAYLLNNRVSSIYHDRPSYSIFGVGTYTFSPWKVAISGFYKELKFRLIESFDGKPIVFDDTCYFIPATSFEEAAILHTLLDHPITQEFYQSFIYWNSKRPITKEILQQLDLRQLISEIGIPTFLDLIQRKYENLKRDIIATTLNCINDSNYTNNFM
ncbi:MAG: SAM-dependent DNA methyltransferase [Promethearchaeota archaeon]